jgi:TonB family protein
MTNGVRAVLCVAALSITLAAQTEPVLLSANIPIYPPLAAQARIEGIVKLTFTLRANGEPINVQVVSGHVQLKSAAVENVETWRFKTPYAEGKYETEFDYRFACSGPQRDL